MGSKVVEKLAPASFGISGAAHEPRSRPRQIVAIQYLRGLAAMLVVLHHSRSPAGQSFMPVKGLYFASGGVDVFFVISGFIMFASARNESALSFIHRRLTRIVPLYWLATLVWLLFNVAIHNLTGITLSHLLYSLFFVPQFSPTYAGHPWPYLTPGWTLNYEMFFYAIFVIGLLRGAVLSTTLFVITVLVAVGLVLHPSSAAGVVYTDPRMLEFASGMLVGGLSTRTSLEKLWPLLPLGMLALLVSDLVALPPVLRLGVPALAIVTGAIAVEARGIGFRSRFLRLLGDASYSIYLFHVIAIACVSKLWKYLPLTGWRQYLSFCIATLLTSAAAGVAGHWLIEKPLLRRLSARRRHGPATGVAPAVSSSQ